MRWDNPTQLANFWARVEKTETCWLWTGNLVSAGYGYTPEQTYAHRDSYVLATGEDITGLHIDHICHVTRCVNPSHLRATTRSQNLQNRKGAQRNSKSGVRGVCWSKQRSKWRARVRHVDVGFFDDLTEAGEAVRLKRLELFTHSDMDKEPTC